MTISVIIKSLNEEQNIAACIASVLADGTGMVSEIIVADSGSKDHTIAIAKQFPVTIVQLQPPAKAGCGVGAQLGYQYSHSEFVCLLDGDMELAPDFLRTALSYLKSHPPLAGVTGHIREKDLRSLEYQRRAIRQRIENPVGLIDRMNGGGLYRRASIQSTGYLSDRNLHAYEELDLGLRLSQKKWQLRRLDIPFVSHKGHSQNAYLLLKRRWRSGYLQGSGEILRAASSGNYLRQLIRALPELKLWALVYGWWLVFFAALLGAFVNFHWLWLAALVALAPVLLMAMKQRSFSMGLYSVVAWMFHAAALPFGFLKKRISPQSFIESKILQKL
ncbi:glycosyltransferase family 2 protein [Paenochrobactrum sp. BZR 588]|uniref:glycosyltransferase family 2 protein n=1 Tax=unclassified Paenochrobactrum TaxID=2639760 RepID=UPI00385364F3